MNETCVERIQGEDYCTFYSSERKYINLILQYAKDYPDEVKIQAHNDDGSILARVPANWFKPPKPPVKRNYTDEQKAAMSERMAIARQNRKTSVRDQV